MANQTFREVAGLALLRCPSAALTLAQSWVQQSWRDIVERRRWSFMLKRGQLVTTAQFNTGTVTTTAGVNTVTITTTGTLSNSNVGQQFRVGTADPIYTITAVSTGASPFTVTLDQVYEPASRIAQSFSIYTAYKALPSDFHAFVSVVDPNFMQPVPFSGSVLQIDKTDPQRAAAGSPPRSLSFFDYYNNLPRYELWPHQRSAYVYPMVYEYRPPEPWDAAAFIPYWMPADIILERAMMYCAMWPGPDETRPNPYFSPRMGLAQMHQSEYERRIGILEKQDNEHMQQNIWYQSEQVRNTPNVISGSWMQQHDMS